MSNENKLTIIKQEGNQYFVQIPRGRELVESMEEVLKETKAKSLFCFALGGGLENVKAYLSQSKKVHGSDPKLVDIPGFVELNTGVINTTTLNKKPFIHFHGSLTKGEDLKEAIGGHIVNAKVGLTIEMKVFASDVEIFRDTEKETGLPLKLTSEGVGRFNNREWFVIASFVTVVVWLSVITFFLVKMLKKSK